ncbi:type I 3-dehydroquinate dehydratase [Fervidobacterium pennivorans subsp. carthaginiensis]|uniref:type I 3-dehydroquinate dehydratase n=1 Tax=Fervidobacterium pennivorans TaxID=93466 RepID=UPI00355BF31F
MGVEKSDKFREYICASIGSCHYTLLDELDERYPFYEIRVDLIDFDTSDVGEIIDKLKSFLKRKKNRCIVTCRSGKLSDDECFEIIKAAIECNVEFIDVEAWFGFNYDMKLRKMAKNTPVKFISSFHDYEKTDRLKGLRIKVDGLFTVVDPEADYVKIATFVHNEEDVFNLLKICAPRVIVVGMGEMGKLVRLLSPIFGSPFTYAAALTPTAPGQPSYDELLKAYESLDEYMLGKLKDYFYVG